MSDWTEGLPLFEDADPPCPHCGKRASQPVRQRKVLTRADVVSKWKQVARAMPPFAKGSSTSLDAARYIVEHGEGLRIAVLTYLAGCGEKGATDDEGAEATGIYRYTYAPRRTELLNVGLVEPTGDSAPTGRGDGSVEAARWRVPAEVRAMMNGTLAVLR